MSSSIVLPPGLSISPTALVQQLITNPTYDDILVLAILLAGGFAYVTRGLLWDRPDPFDYQWYERPQAAVANLVAASKQTRNVAEKLAETDKRAVIFWGSQSGTAEGFAYRLARDLHRRLKLEALVADVSDYDHHTMSLLPKSHFAVFIMSTFGEGDPSDNSNTFLSWLKSNPEISLNNLSFAAFGCGNSNYKYYNAVIDTVVASLQSLGGNMFLPVGKADEAKDTTDEDFLDWKTTLSTRLCSLFSLEEREPEYEPSIKVVFDDSIDISGVYVGEPNVGKARATSSPSSAVVPLPITNSCELIAAGTARSCLHLELDLSDQAEVRYKTGDHMAVQSVNPKKEVSALIQILNLDSQENIPIMIQVVDPSVRIDLPSPTTISALFHHYLEICAPVSRETLLSLAQFALTASAKACIRNLAEKTSFANLIAEQHITLARLLKHISTVDCSATWSDLPLSFVIECLRPMTPRYYSISSSSITSPRRATITVANNPQILTHDQTIPGLASTYISSLLSSSSSTEAYAPIVSSLRSSSIGPSPATPYLHASVRRSTFKLPASHSTPLVLVAAGTGVAPFRAFLHERTRLASIYGASKPLGQTILFFGCRHPELDLLYKNELRDFEKTLPGLEIVYAFSRLEGEKKTYVQDRIEERKEEVVRLLLEADAGLFICGNAMMAREVGERIGEGVRVARGTDDEGVKKWREERKGVRRWQEDVWG